jgi:hypothetical protein
MSGKKSTSKKSAKPLARLNVFDPHAETKVKLVPTEEEYHAVAARLVADNLPAGYQDYDEEDVEEMDRQTLDESFPLTTLEKYSELKLLKRSKLDPPIRVVCFHCNLPTAFVSGLQTKNGGTPMSTSIPGTAKLKCIIIQCATPSMAKDTCSSCPACIAAMKRVGGLASHKCSEFDGELVTLNPSQICICGVESPLVCACVICLGCKTKSGSYAVMPDRTPVAGQDREYKNLFKLSAKQKLERDAKLVRIPDRVLFRYCFFQS